MWTRLAYLLQFGVDTARYKRRAFVRDRRRRRDVDDRRGCFCLVEERRFRRQGGIQFDDCE